MIKSKVRRNGSFIDIDYAIVGQAGERYEKFAVKDNRAVRKAKVRIVDEMGNTFEAGSFKYGWGGNCRYSWRVPKDFKGKYQVLVDVDLGPFEIEQEKTWHFIT